MAQPTRNKIPSTLRSAHEGDYGNNEPSQTASVAAESHPSKDGLITTLKTEHALGDVPNGNLSASRKQRRLSKSHIPSLASERPSTISRESSERSVKSNTSPEEKDLEMDVSDGEQDKSDDSDEESGRPSKKKKGQRFFCTDFPPCQLSFTRSEHLARHIRKHTGERPFQCHCNRRFSRLDNLRQHAQTVHVNEDIPGDSLAATGTRFQRQIRTDRVRPPGPRPRSGTMGSHSGHSRGHSRNLSTSSIASTTSTFSTSQDVRRRPPSLVMVGEGVVSQNMMDPLGSPPTTPTSQFSAYTAHSPGGFSTPNSATFSAGPLSPAYGSMYGSPVRAMPSWDSRISARRLSVPSNALQYEDRHQAMPMTFGGPLPGTSGAPYLSQSSAYASPTSSNFSFSRNEPELTAAEAEHRRRTWHPSSHWNYQTSCQRPATSGLSYSQTPDAPQPAFASNATTAAGQRPRLPGIESFDEMSRRPLTPPRRQATPMQIDESQSAPSFAAQHAQGPAPAPTFRKGHQSRISWDLNRLNIHGPASSKDAASQWSQQVIGELNETGSRALSGPQIPPQPHRPTPITIPHEPLPPSESQQSTPRKSKRQGWYNGPLSQTSPSAAQPTRISPEDSSSSEGIQTPSTGTLDYHPAILHSDSMEHNAGHNHYAIAPDHHQTACVQSNPDHGNAYAMRQPHALYGSSANNPAADMGRLEALVAVATSEEQAATKSY